MATSSPVLNVKFILKKDKLNAISGEAPIYARVLMEKRVLIAIKRSIKPERWNEITGYAKGRNEHSRALNSYIDGIRNRLTEHFEKLEKGNAVINAANFKRTFLDPNSDSYTLVQAFEYRNNEIKDRIGTDYAQNTYNRYIYLLNVVKQFLEKQYGVNDMFLNQLDLKFIKDFEYYIRTTKNSAHNTTVKYVRTLKSIIHFAMDNDWLDKDPFRKFKPKKMKDSERRYLTLEELHELEEKEFAVKRLEEIRDMFVFSCYTGYSFSDMAKLTPDNIVKHIDGGLWIFKNREKNDNKSNVPLLPKAQELIEKYNDHPVCNETGRIFPTRSNQKHNAFLKEIQLLCGLEKNLTTHVARHTCATTVLLSNDVPLETVSEILGHESIKTTQVYAKIVQSKIGKDIGALKEKLAAQKEQDGQTASSQ